jgi:hypothetical protein
MTTRTIRTEAQLDSWVAFLRGRKLPLTVSVIKGEARSLNQNRTQFLWFAEIARQLGDMTPEDVRAYCKLHLAVPILRQENEAFRDVYDRILRPLPYEHKLACMSPPIDMPVTSQMTKPQAMQYLDAMQQHWAERGIVLTNPDPITEKIQC